MGWNPFDSKSWDLKRLPGPLGAVAKALNDPYKAATKAVANTLKGTPLGGFAEGLQKASVGDIRGAARSYVSSVAHVTGLDNLPGLQQATAAITNIGANLTNIGAAAAKAAGGAGIPKLNISLPGNLNAIVSVMPPVSPALSATPILPQRTAPAPQAVVDNAIARTQTSVAGGAFSSSAVKLPKARRPVRTFSKVEWASHASLPETVGGTQPAPGT